MPDGGVGRPPEDAGRPRGASRKGVPGPVLILPERPAKEPRVHWLYRSLRDAILSGQLAAGDRLPPTRVLAETQGLTRGTVVEAYEQLCAEGFADGRFGGGTVVLQTGAPAAAAARQPAGESNGAGARVLSARGTSLADPDALATLYGLSNIRLAATDLFPAVHWQRLYRQRLRAQPELLRRFDHPGVPELQQAIAQYLRTMRAVRCQPQQIFLFQQLSHAISVQMQLLLDPGEKVWIEDPGQPSIHLVGQNAGLQVIPVPTDTEGFDVAAATALADARLAVVSPAHQDVYGTPMTRRRRLALLDWAETSKGWIFESDCESEFRYQGRPTTSLHGLSDGRRVFYAGSFNRLLFPGLRLTYMVVPEALVGAFTAARERLLYTANPITQSVLAAFLADGSFDRHMRRMREVYRARLHAFRIAIERHAGDLVRLDPVDTGMSVVGWLASGITSQAAAAAAASAGLRAEMISAYAVRAELPHGLMFGFTTLEPADADRYVEAFARALRAPPG